MGTRVNPGKYDCYHKAEHDEPVFVLLGRDPVAAVVVRFWVQMRRLLGGTEPDKLIEASRCADDMQDYAIHIGREGFVRRAVEAVAADSEISEEDMVRACRITAGNIARTGPGALRELAREFAHYRQAVTAACKLVGPIADEAVQHALKRSAERCRLLEDERDAIRDILDGKLRKER